MKKTSKKLLSFFLAVVMIVTSCSVGFTAFAADKTKANTGYWSQDADAQAAFEALNDVVDEYVPMLLNIPAIKTLLEDNLGMKITEETTIPDVVEGASPLLLGLLTGASADKGAIRGDYTKLADKYFAYLDDPDAIMDFYSLYDFCQKNPGIEYKDEKTGKTWSSDAVLADLDKLLNVYKDSKNEYDTKFGDASNLLINDIQTAVADAYPDYLNATIEQIENVEVFGGKFKDYKNETAQFMVDYYKGLFDSKKGLNSVAKIDNIADAFYYTVCDSGKKELSVEIYLGLSIIGGAKITTESIGGTASDILTMSNYKELIAKADPTITPFEFFVKNDRNFGAFDSEFYNDICKGFLAYNGFDLNELKAYELNDEQITKFMDDTFTNGAIFEGRNSKGVATVRQGNVEDYLSSDSCALNDYTKEFLLDLIGNGYWAKVRDFLRAVYATDDVAENIKLMHTEKLVFGDDCPNLSDMAFIDAVNYMIPSSFIRANYADNYNDVGIKVANVTAIFDAVNKFEVSIAPTTEKSKFKYADYAVPAALTLDLTNTALNQTIKDNLAPGSMIGGVIDQLLESNVGDLSVLLNDVWKNLYNDPVATVTNLLPIVAIVADELILPLIINGQGDLFNGDQNIIYEILVNGEGTLLYPYSQMAESEIGIGALDFDLNKILPSVLHWISGDKSYDYAGTVGYYDGASVYSADVPKFTNIYIADKAIFDLGNAGIVATLENAMVDPAASAEEQAKQKQTADILGESLTSVASFLLESVDEYLAEHKDEQRVNKDGYITQKGANNIFVALPQIIDVAGKKFLKKYNVDSDWAYAYEGKIKRADNGNFYNNTLNDFKLLATANDPNKVLENGMHIIIGNILNAVLDFANDIVADENNDFVKNFKLVDELLLTLGGLGEKSVITDVLNGFFQTTRSEDNSFTLEKREGTNFNGFSDKNGLFLIANVNKIIDYIKSFISPSSSSDSAKAGSSAENSPLLVNSRKTSAKGSYEDVLTKENIAAANSLINKIDTLLSSLLKNSALNNFELNKTDGILMGLASLECTPQMLKVTTDYIKYANGEEKYNSKNLSNLVTETYSLLESLVKELAGGIDGDKGLVAGAINGVISPDSVGVRLSDTYSKTAKLLLDNNGSWDKFVNTDLKFGFANGDKDGFYKALGESLNGVASVVGLLLSQIKDADGKDYYELILNPLLKDLSKATGSSVSVMTPSAFDSADNNTKLINGVLLPVFGIVDGVFAKPATSLIKTVQALCNYLDDTELVDLLKSAVAPINGTANSLIDGAETITANLSATLVDLLKTINVNIDIIELLDLPESDIIVTLLNGVIGDFVELKPINWKGFAKYSTAEAILVVYTYAFDAIISSDVLRNILEGLDSNLVKFITELTPAQVLTILREVLEVAQTPTEVYWTFSEYASKISKSFTYPTRVSAKDATKAVTQLDGSVEAVFALLKDLGVADINGLSSLVNDNLYTNKMLSTIAIALYSALEGAGINDITSIIGIDVSTKGFAKYLTDSSYGKTFSSVAKQIKGKKWSSFVKTNKDGSKTYKTLNWGFKDGSSKAEAGFVNGLAAIVRPVNDIIAPLLNGGASFEVTTKEVNALVKAIKSISIKEDVVTLKNGILTVIIETSKKNYLQVDLAKIVKDYLSTFIGTKSGIGANGYESAIIPILEAFMCKNVKTQKQYTSDYNKAKDNLIIDILKPVTGLIGDVCDAPFDTVTKILPNVAYFIDSNGVTQAVSNLLSPVTSSKGILGVLKKNGVDLNMIIKAIAGKPLGKIVTDALNIKVDLSIDVYHLEKCNAQDIVLPVVAKLLKEKLGINLPKFDFETIASHGSIKTVKSSAKNANGKYTTRRVVADQGEVLIAVLRYVSDTLIHNTTPIKKLLLNIDAIKKNSTIKNIIVAVLNQLKTADKDDIIRALFYLLMGEGQDKFFDYSQFKFNSSGNFSWGDLDQKFCESLPPMLDGLVGGLLEGNGGLLGMIENAVYTDELVGKLATGLYGAIEGVQISPEIGSLTSLLSHFDVDFSTANVASLLMNKDYGETYLSAAAKIKSAGSWKNVKAGSLSFGVKDRESFVNALCAVLRPLYGVLDVFLNDSYLNLANIATVPGTDCYTSAIVPLLEAFSCYNIKTQYQYREDMDKKYDAILIDILNPLLDKVEDLLIAPVQTLTSMLPNLSLFFANDGLLQVIDNLLTPVSALIEALRPIVDVNKLLEAIDFNINKLLAGTGLDLNINLDIYDIKGTLKPLIGSENVVTLLNKILGIIKIKGTPLGIVLPEIDWLQLATHGDVITNGTSQAGSSGSRVYVIADSAEQEAETLIAVLRFVIDTVNYKGNYDAIVKLVGGLLGEGVSESVSDVIGQVLGMLKGDSDKVITDLVDLLQSLAG